MGRDDLRGESIYFRNMDGDIESGTIQSLIKDLQRIKELGITTIWISPHYLQNKPSKKVNGGELYAISDYYTVNPEIGGLNDFKQLVSECHELELKLIIDVVFNHISSESQLVEDHPNWFLYTDNGERFGKLAFDKSISDFDFKNNDLKNYLISILEYWAEIGVDGFRCDIAAIIPLSFWHMAKDTLNKNYKELIWIGESVDKQFISFIRHKGYNCHSDSELYNVFDVLYDYDVQYSLTGYIQGTVDFISFIKERKNQEVVYPQDYLKLRFLENNDSKQRAATLIENYYTLVNWKAFSILESGIPLINNGEEYALKDDSDVRNEEYFHIVKTLLHIKSMYIVTEGIYTIHALTDDCVHIRYRYNGETLHGIFNFGEKDRDIEIEVLKGTYKNILTGIDFNINHQQLDLNNAPYIFKSIP